MIKHIGFIMDGNRRYAKKNNLQLNSGYKKGMEKFLEIISYQIKYKIYETSFFALSKENYEKRPEEEKKILFSLIDLFSKNNEIKEFFIKNKIKVNLKGNLTTLSKKDKIAKKIITEFNKWNLKDKPKFQVNIAINYNGQDEILNSFKNILKKIENEEINPKYITKKTIKDNLYFNENTEPQIIVRTGNVPRISGFMLWDSNYSEIYLTHKLWPEMDEIEFIKIMDWYKSLNRNFGK